MGLTWVAKVLDATRHVSPAYPLPPFSQAVFEITEAALAAVSNATGAGVGQRNIPVEAMYLVMNLGRLLFLEGCACCRRALFRESHVPIPPPLCVQA